MVNVISLLLITNFLLLDFLIDYNSITVIFQLILMSYDITSKDDKLPKELAPMDNGSPANLEKLEQFAKDLLNKPITRLNPATFERSEIESGHTYGKALEE